MPLIIPTNSISDLGYNVDNSLRFDGTSNLTRTPASDGNLTTMTFSFWIKRSKLGTDQRLVSTNYVSTSLFYMRFNTDDTIRLIGYSGGGATIHVNKVTNRVFRDTSAWYHLVITLDSTNATAEDRCKIFINGERETSFSASSNPSLNRTFVWNKSSYKNDIGHYANDGSKHVDGYMSEFCFIDGTALDATSFGEFDTNSGIWKPIDVSGLTFGTNGFYLPFENSGALGQDDSGNGNNYTVNNLTSIDQTTDTPTNNFATLNPLVTLSGGTLSEGNNKFNYGSNSWRSSFSTIGANSGKWYCEVKYDSGTYAIYGIVDEDGYSRNSGNQLADVTFNYSHGYGYFNNTGNKQSTGKDGQSTATSYGNSFTTGDIIGIAMDLDNGKLYFSKNGVFQNSGDPTSGATGTGSAYNITNSTSLFYFFGVSVYNGTALLNTGNPSFTISSGNSDANGYGNFEYAPPSGYYALNTKNLSEYG